VKLDGNQLGLLWNARVILFSAMKVASQIGAAIQHLHENLNIAHNDLKPDNFFAHQKSHPLLPGSKELFGSNLLNSDGTIIPNNPNEADDEVAYYLSDFGFAKKIGFATPREGEKFFKQKPWVYLAPEI
jgi:serine/threonine protein kinase